MDIATLSVVLKQSQVKQQAGLAVMKNAMSTAETKGNALVEMLSQSTNEAPHPSLGTNMDLKG